MKCVNCLNEFATEDLTKEHIIPSSLGGCLQLKYATCSYCNNKFLNTFDDFLSNKFLPTTLARTDLNIASSHNKKTIPRAPIKIFDEKLGIIHGKLNPPGSKEIVSFTKPVIKIGNDLFALGSNFDEALRALSKATKRTVRSHEISEHGKIKPKYYEFSSINWDYAKLAAAKILYLYILLEMGADILENQSMKALRNFYSQSFFATKIGIRIIIDNHIITGRGKFEVPRHTHVLMFDTSNEMPTLVCLFGRFWFIFDISLCDLSPHGRLIGIDPRKRKLIESSTKYMGEWRFRISHNFGWWKRTGETEIEFIRNQE